MSLLLVGVALAAAPLRADPYRHGDRIRIEGSVIDETGEPLPGIEVVLEAFRVGFSLRHFEETIHDRQDWIATTDDAGRFALPWRWDRYFNRLELSARMPEAAGREEPMTTIDLDRALTGESAVTLELVVADLQTAENARAWVRASEDQREVWRQAGPPERIGADDVGGVRETSWWYFQTGRVYRFRNGELAETGTFTPVPPATSQQN